MTELEQRLRGYVAARADRISQNDGELLITRALARPAPRGRWGRHGINAAAAAVLSLLLIAGGVVLQAQLHGFRIGAPAPGAGPLPPIPNEIVYLDNPLQGPEFESPFRLKDGKLLAPRYRWVLPQNRALVVTPATDCSTTTIRVVDRATGDATRPTVKLNDCYSAPVILPGTSVLLSHFALNTPKKSLEDHGAIAYDWSSGRVVRDYPNLSLGFVGGLVSPDGALLYTINPYIEAPVLEITELASGARLAHVPVAISGGGLNAGGLALSVDGRTVYVNQGDQLGTFDARTGAAGLILKFEEKKITALRLPAWLSAVEADAKEGFEPGHGIAVDPKGRWVAALGAASRETEGAWLFSLEGTPHLVRRIDRNGALGGIAFSLNGNVLYLVERQSYLVLIDPQTGRTITQFRYPETSGVYGIAGVEAP